MNWVLIYSFVLDIGSGPDLAAPLVKGIFPSHAQCEQGLIDIARSQSGWEVRFVNVANKDFAVIGSYASRVDERAYEWMNCSPFRE